jgi:hypothetical protein
MNPSSNNAASFKYSTRKRIISKNSEGINKYQYMKRIRLNSKLRRVKSQIEQLDNKLFDMDLSIDNDKNTEIIRHLKSINTYLNSEFTWIEKSPDYTNINDFKIDVLHKMKLINDEDIEQSHRGLFNVMTRLLDYLKK